MSNPTPSSRTKYSNRPLAGRAPISILPRDFFAEFVGAILEQRRAESIDAAERCPQIVRHRVGKTFQFVIGLLQFSRAMPERFSLPFQFMLDAFSFRDVANRDRDQCALLGPQW